MTYKSWRTSFHSQFIRSDRNANTFHSTALHYPRQWPVSTRPT